MTADDAGPGGARSGARRVYSAPALEKGLDVLELLARQEAPLTAAAIVQQLGRSTGELFRMIQVLERRGYVEPTREGYTLSPKLFRLGLQRPPVRSLVEAALPRMRALSTAIGQSCHIGFPSGADMVVVARMESQEQLGYSVRVGYRKPLHLTTSGLLLYAFQEPEVRSRWEAGFAPPPAAGELEALRAAAADVRRGGFARRPSGFVEGVIDLAAPLWRGARAAAALSVPFMRLRQPTISEDDALEALMRAAEAISAELVGSDGGV